MKIFLLAALLATSAYAQERHFDCSKAKDPKVCEERIAKMKATHTQAEKACEGRQGAERRDCMVRSMCAQQKDPKACEERAKSMRIRRLFALTTHAAHWFLEQGFRAGDVAALPSRRQALYNWRRGSKVFLKRI